MFSQFLFVLDVVTDEYVTDIPCDVSFRGNIDEVESGYSSAH